MRRWIVLGFGLAGLAATPAQAEDDVFGYTYGAETLPKGETEMELWATDRRGKDQGHYDAQDYKLELEHGFTDTFSVSAYVNLLSQHTRGLDPEFERTNRDFAFNGFSAELKYNVLSPEKDGFGLTFYAEPGWSRISNVTGEKANEYELDLKAIVQKNFLKDRLVWAANLTLEPEWQRERELDPGATRRKTEKELGFELSTGLAYRIAPKWWLGAEARYHSAYPDWTDGLHRENYAIHAGPTIHYDGRGWAGPATWLP